MAEADTGIRDPKSRLTRRCDFCTQIDDHPHIHIFYDDGTSKSGHHDCAAATGYEDAQKIVAAAKGKQGATLTKFLEAGGAKHVDTPMGELPTFVHEQEV